MSQRPMVSASRHFAHYYSDKVVKRTKWSIFVPGQGRTKVACATPIAPKSNLELHHRAVIVAVFLFEPALGHTTKYKTKRSEAAFRFAFDYSHRTTLHTP
jgi:hypothetical protein